MVRRVEHFASLGQLVQVDCAGHPMRMDRMTMSFVRRADRGGPSAQPV